MPVGRITRGLLDLLLPQRCLICNTIVDSHERPVPLCYRHFQDIETLKTPNCHFCAKPLEDSAPSKPDGNYPEEPVCGDCRKKELLLDRTEAGYKFVDPLRDIVADWKYNGRKIWGEWLGTKLWKQVQERVNPEGWDILVPIPLHRKRRKDRGFNQAHQLAQGIASRSGLEVRPVLRKHRRTDRQSNLGRDERLDNLDGALSLDSGESNESVSGKNILLVDDIFTTGSTLRTAADVLSETNCNNLGALVLARAIPQRN